MALNTSWSNRLIADLQTDFGLSLGAAQGMAGAFAMESQGFNTMQEISPTVAGSKGGFGMAQWTGPRRKALESYAASNGLDINSYETQYGYLRQELKGVGRHDNGIIKKLKDVTDPQVAQQLVTGSAASGTGFLRPGIVHANARADWTNQVVKNYVPLPPGSIPTVGTQLDLNGMGQKVAPTPKTRTQGQVARTRAALGLGPTSASLAESLDYELRQMPPVPKPAAQGAKARANAAQQQSGQTTIQFTTAGKPIDPDNGFLMDKSDPRWPQGTPGGTNNGSNAAPKPHIKGSMLAQITNDTLANSPLNKPGFSGDPGTPAAGTVVSVVSTKGSKTAKGSTSDQRAEQLSQQGKSGTAPMLPVIGPTGGPGLNAPKTAPPPASVEDRVTARNNAAAKATAAATQKNAEAAIQMQRAEQQQTMQLTQMLDQAGQVGISMTDAIRSKAPLPASLEQRARAEQNAAAQAIASVSEVAPKPMPASSKPAQATTTLKNKTQTFSKGQTNQSTSKTKSGSGGGNMTRAPGSWFSTVTGT